MRVMSLPGFLPALRAARAQRPELPDAAWWAAAHHAHPSFARAGLRADPALLIALAEHCYVASLSMRGGRCA